MIPTGLPLLGEEEQEAVRPALTSGQPVQREYVAGCERRFGEVYSVRGTVEVSSGLGAFNLVLSAHDSGHGYEAIAADLSFAAMVKAILRVSAMSVVVNIEHNAYTLGLSLMDAALSQVLLAHACHRHCQADSRAVSLPGSQRCLRRSLGVQLKVWDMGRLYHIQKCKRFIRKVRMRIEIEFLQLEDRFLYNGNIHLPEIALTFDDGPDPLYTPKILNILQRYRVKATFFCVGRQIMAYPYLVRQAFEAGHVIANHSWSHPDLGLMRASAVLSELDRTSGLIQEVTGMRPIFFRPPYGYLNSQVLAQTRRLGFTTIMWKDDTKDWASPGIDFIVNRALESSSGAIVLMHDGVSGVGNDRSQTLAALPSIIEGLQKRGFRFVTVQQMVDHLHNHGSVYAPKRYHNCIKSNS